MLNEPAPTDFFAGGPGTPKFWTAYEALSLQVQKRSPDERSDIRVIAFALAPACRFAHPGYLL
jgi:hypothetical protein